MGIDAAVLQLRRGDPDALATLMARYQNRIYRYLLRLVRQPADAEDLFQQTWLRVAEKIRSFDTLAEFRRVAFHAGAQSGVRSPATSAAGQPGRAAERRIRRKKPMVSRLASGDPGPFDQLLAHERAGRLAVALEDLPVSYREVLSLRFEEEMKLEEIALVLARRSRRSSRVFTARSHSFAACSRRAASARCGNEPRRRARRESASGWRCSLQERSMPARKSGSRGTPRHARAAPPKSSAGS